MKRNAIYAVIALIIFGVGFFSGMEYKAYQVRSAITNAFDGNSDNDPKPQTAMEEAKKEDMVITQKAVGDDIALATIKVKVTGSEEKKTISSSYGSPKVAKDGTRFVVVNMEITNTTNSKFSLPADFLLIDDKEREFSTYSDTIGGIDNYLDYRELSPSVKETGVYVYEIPTDATSYSLTFAKAGSKDVYQVKLK
jgi:hypothetical protein